MERLMKLMAVIVGLGATLSAQNPDLAKALQEYDQYAKSAEGAAALKSAGEMTLQMTQFRKDLDLQSEQIRNWQKAGLLVNQHGQAISPDQSQRRDMLAAQRCFFDDNMARDFGAWFVDRYLTTTGHKDSVPAYIRDMAAPILQRQIEEYQQAKTLGLAAKADSFVDPATVATGQALIPADYRREIIRNVEATGVFYTQARRIPLATIGTTYIPKRTAGVTAYFTAYGAQGQTSVPAFSLISLTPQKLMALVGVPNEFLRSTTLVDIGQFIGYELVYQFADRLDDVFLNGGGAAVDGMITGILNSATVSTTTPTSGHTTLASLTGTDFALFVAGLTKSYAWERARWGMSLPVFAAIRGLKSTIGTPLYAQGLFGQPPAAAIGGTQGDRQLVSMTAPAAGEPGTIEGFPYTIGPKMPLTAAAASSKVCIFGDLAKSHVVGQIQDLIIDVSREAYFPADMTAFRAIAYVAMAEQDPNALVVCKTAA